MFTINHETGREPKIRRQDHIRKKQIQDNVTREKKMIVKYKNKIYLIKMPKQSV